MKTGRRGGVNDDGGRFQVMWECIEVPCVQQGLAMRIVLLCLVWVSRVQVTIMKHLSV